MRKIVTLMLALGGLTLGCGEDQSDDVTSEPQAQVLDAGRVDTGSASSDAGAPSTKADAGAAKSASAVIDPRSGNTTLSGTITFDNEGGVIVATVTVTGAPPGTHGVHLHAKGDCSAADATSAGDHWNPTTGQHGPPGSATSHLGDLGNLTVAADGTGTLSVPNAKWTIGDGSATDVVGHAIVVHGGADDLTTQPSGASGARIGCGVVALD